MVKKVKNSNFALISAFFLTKWRFSLLLFVFLVGTGAAVYTNVIKREGFPPIQFPLNVVSGTYFVDDSEKVDKEVNGPLYESVSQIEGIDKVEMKAGPNFYSAVVIFEIEVDPVAANQAVVDAIASSSMPEQTKQTADVLSLDAAGFLNEFDLLLSVFSTEATSVEDLEEVARFVAEDFVDDPQIVKTEVQELLTTAQNPITEQVETRQTSFNQIGLTEDNSLNFFSAVTIGVNRDEEQIDALELSDLAKSRINNIDLSQFGENYRVVIGADQADTINNQIYSLQSNLLTGLIAVALVSFLLITWRASIITALFIVSVMAVSVFVLYLFGYTLNTITLFALVLALGLFVDDATIVVEAIYASRDGKKKPVEVVKAAIGKIGAASFAGTFTTVLVFLPMAFISGILGEFIRLMPITIMIALITSLVLSLTLIPLLAKFILLRKDKSGWLTHHNPVVKLERWLGKIAGNSPRLLKTNPKLGRLVATGMVILSIAMFMLSGTFANKVDFNIFPPTKDSDQIGFQITYPNGYTIPQAEEVVDQINNVIKQDFEPVTKRVLYGSFTQPNNRNADAFVELVSFKTRDIKAPQIIDDLQASIKEAVPSDVTVRVIQYDAGPPVSEYPLTIQIYDEDTGKAVTLATEVNAYINGATIERSNGTTARITETKPPTMQTVDRNDGKRVLVVGGSFDADDTSALLVSAEKLVKEKFTPEYLSSNGYSEDALGFDFGQETENAESFSALLFAFPIALLLMYLLLASQFRSFLQPVLIFMAIPFTFLGVFMGLYYTNNAISFFVQVGLLGLIGIAVNNTILLVTYANQEKNAGIGTIDAISNAVTKRFRPLVATTITTVAALTPLALSDPFWEPLAYTIIFGLISSTLLVLVSFPYYYLATEWIRMRFSRGTRKARKSKKSKTT